MNIALIAHDRLKDALVDIVADFAQLLALHRHMATRTTGERIRAQVGLDIECLLSGPLGETSRSAPGSPLTKWT